MLDNLNFRLPRKLKTAEKACQTGDHYEIFSMISKTKSIHFRYSNKLKDYIVDLTFSNLKHYIIRREEWINLQVHFKI